MAEGPEVCWESHPIAKKWYKCYECEQWIPKGQKYTKITGKWYGDFDSHKFHEECAEAMSIVNSWLEEPLSFGDLYEAIKEYCTLHKRSPKATIDPDDIKVRHLMATCFWKYRNVKPTILDQLWIEPPKERVI
jgi:hypothetical protein